MSAYMCTNQYLLTATGLRDWYQPALCFDRNPYFVTGQLGGEPLRPNLDVYKENNDAAGENDRSETDNLVQILWVDKGPPSSKGQVQAASSPTAMEKYINFYNKTYTDFLQKQVLEPSTTKSLQAQLRDLFEQIAVTRYKEVGKMKRVVQMKPDDKDPCNYSKFGVGIFLAQYPPSLPFLHFAAKLGSVQIVDHLITYYGCYANLPAAENMTPLHYAAYYGHLAVVEAILRANPDVTLRNSKGETAADSAKAGEDKYKQLVREGRQEEFFPIIRRKNGTRSQFKSSWRGQWQSIISLLNERPLV